MTALHLRRIDPARARTGEGRARAKARGVTVGRKPKLTQHQKRAAMKRRDHGDETIREIARSYNVSHSTISRLAARASTTLPTTAKPPTSSGLPSGGTLMRHHQSEQGRKNSRRIGARPHCGTSSLRPLSIYCVEVNQRSVYSEVLNVFDRLLCTAA